MEALKARFTALVNSKKPTGAPDIPPNVLRAKRIWRDIGNENANAVMGFIEVHAVEDEEEEERQRTAAAQLDSDDDVMRDVDNLLAAQTPLQAAPRSGATSALSSAERPGKECIIVLKETGRTKAVTKYWA